MIPTLLHIVIFEKIAFRIEGGGDRIFPGTFDFIPYIRGYNFHNCMRVNSKEPYLR